MQDEQNILTYFKFFILAFVVVIGIVILLNLSEKEVSDKNLYKNTSLKENQPTNDLSKTSQIELDEILNNKNSSNCKVLPNKNDQLYCMAFFDICPTGDDNCIYQKARLQRNTQVCKEISNSETSNLCLIEIRENNIVELALLTNNVTTCINLNDIQKQDNCKDNYYHVKSIELENINLCQNITQEEIKKECLSQ